MHIDAGSLELVGRGVYFASPVIRRVRSIMVGWISGCGFDQTPRVPLRYAGIFT